MAVKQSGKSTGFVNKHHDGNRQRCIECGHPRREHHNEGCGVPKCKCVVYAALAVAAPKAEAAGK